VVIVVFVLVLSIGVFAEAVDIREEIINFMEDKGVIVDGGDIEEIDFNDLPGELDIESVDNTSVGIYQVEYGNRSLFVVGYSGETKSSAPKSEVRYLLSFGSSKKIKKSGFLDMASGVEGSLDKGYVMMREGSITGISTNLNVDESKGKDDDSSGGVIDIVIYKNGEEVGFRNSLGVGSSGVVIDYDSQSKGIVEFSAGDVISVYLNSNEGVSVSDITTMLEITE